jgi:IclR family transcriptional regulator, pca regulon regulatory protein
MTDAERIAATSSRGEHEVGADYVQSLARGLSVIKAFDAEHPELTLSDVARAAGLTRASARRFLRTLTELGYVRSNGRLFALRPRVLELGYAYLSSLSLHEVALPHLEHLVGALRESSSVSVLDADDVVYIARVPTRRIMTITISVGTRFPAYATSMGRVLLAGQTDDWLDGYFATVELRRLTARTVTDVDVLRAELLLVRAQGWSFVDEELEEGLRAIAAPIHDLSGRVTAAVNVSSPVSRGSADLVREEFLPHLLAAARGIEEDLRHSTSGSR